MRTLAPGLRRFETEPPTPPCHTALSLASHTLGGHGRAPHSPPVCSVAPLACPVPRGQALHCPLCPSSPQVESLTAARNACRAGTEPSDAIRVVNAVLTQIDQIKR